jgi:serine/threonine protein kinase
MSNKYYTIKFLNHNSHNVKDINFLFKEINILMRLKHPQIIELYSFCLTDENEFALIMEYIPGGTLKEYIKKNKQLDEEEAKKILKQILEIILYCHKMNIIHHDLKPDNILFTDDIHKQIKIIDFGISSLMYDQSDAGSLLYLPPEIITHKDVTSSPSVDVWSIGCIFGEMLKGECLFKGENITKIKHLISSGDYELPKNISNLASDLLKKMLKLSSKERISVNSALLHPFFNNEMSITINSENSLAKEITNKAEDSFGESDNKQFYIKIPNKSDKFEEHNIIFNRNKFVGNKKLNVLKKKNSKLGARKRGSVNINTDNNTFNKILKRPNIFNLTNTDSLTSRAEMNKNSIKCPIKLMDNNNYLNNHTIDENNNLNNNSNEKEKDKDKGSFTDKKKDNKNLRVKLKNSLNLLSRENMARNKLLINLKKVENYKNELSELKTSRYSYGPPSKYSKDNEIKRTPDLITRTNNISEDELISYWIKLSNKYDCDIPNYLKPIGLSREQKHKIERFAKSLERCNERSKIKRVENNLLNKNKSQNGYVKRLNKKYISTRIENNNIRKKSPTKTMRILNNYNKKKFGTSGKLILPNLVNNNSINKK